MAQSNTQNIFAEWALWYFYEMPKFFLEVWKNYLLFGLNYFSVIALLKSMFAPWRMYRWVYPKGFNVIEFLNTLISNTFSRMIGAIMRIFLILFGIIFLIFIVVAGFLIIVGWLLIPLVIVGGFLFAINF